MIISSWSSRVFFRSNILILNCFILLLLCFHDHLGPPVKYSQLFIIASYLVGTANFIYTYKNKLHYICMNQLNLAYSSIYLTILAPPAPKKTKLAVEDNAAVVRPNRSEVTRNICHHFLNIWTNIIPKGSMVSDEQNPTYQILEIPFLVILQKNGRAVNIPPNS